MIVHGTLTRVGLAQHCKRKVDGVVCTHRPTLFDASALVSQSECALRHEVGESPRAECQIACACREIRTWPSRAHVIHTRFTRKLNHKHGMVYTREL